jgi:mRNA-degrading endonuclease RelE of RelBE toxin-antitoxin system
MRYQVMLLPRARRVLDKLRAPERNALLDALKRDLRDKEAIAERVESDGQTYLRAPLGPRHHVLYRSLSDDEVRRLVDQNVLADKARPAYAVLSIDRSDNDRSDNEAVA